MTGTSFFDILGVAIGIVFVFLLLSILTSWIQEYIATWREFRSKDLVNIFQNMLDPNTDKLEGVKKLNEKWAEGIDASAADQLTKNAVKALYENQTFKSLSKPGKLPSYVSSRDFTVALFDLLSKAGKDALTKLETDAQSKPEKEAHKEPETEAHKEPETEAQKKRKITLENITAGIEIIGDENKALKERLQSLINNAVVVEDEIEDQLVAFRNNVYHWFDSSMERASGWYKRKAQILAIIIGIIVAVLFNADTIAISQSLWKDSALRESMGKAAEVLIIEGEATKAKEAQKLLGELGFPLGWSLQLSDIDQETPQDPRDFPNTVGGWALKVLGLLITGLAISQGSSMWFDVLGQLVNLRGTGGKPKVETAGAAES